MFVYFKNELFIITEMVTYPKNEAEYSILDTKLGLRDTFELALFSGLLIALSVLRTHIYIYIRVTRSAGASLTTTLTLVQHQHHKHRYHAQLSSL